MFSFIPSKFSILPENTISSPGLFAWRNKCRTQLSHIGHLSVCRLSWEVCPDYQAVIRMTHLYELSITLPCLWNHCNKVILLGFQVRGSVANVFMKSMNHAGKWYVVWFMEKPPVATMIIFTPIFSQPKLNRN